VEAREVASRVLKRAKCRAPDKTRLVEDERRRKQRAHVGQEDAERKEA
jgi:hypothetical protein